MALRGRRIKYFLKLWWLVGSGRFTIWVSSTSFQKSIIGWPQQPLTERVSDIIKKNWIFDDQFHKKGQVLREYGSSGEDVLVNAVIILKNWVAIPSEGRSPEEGYCSPILRQVQTRVLKIMYWKKLGVFDSKTQIYY